MLVSAVSLVLALLVQGPPRAALLPVSRSSTRSGVAVVVVAAPQSPWAVAQLHVRFDPAELSPRVRAATRDWSDRLAEASRKSIGPTGTVESRLTPDSVVVSFGVEAARVDDAIRAIDSVLRQRGQRPAATVATPIPTLVVVDDVVDAAAARALFPGLPISLPIDGDVVDANSAKALGDAMTPERLAIVVTGPDSGDVLLQRVQRLVTAPLPKADAWQVPSASWSAGKIIHERSGPRSTSSLTSLVPCPTDDAALLVLAHLLGGRFVRSSVAAGVIVEVHAADRVARLAGEDEALDQIRRIAVASPPPEVVESARNFVWMQRLASLSDPGRVAYALGQALSGSRPKQIEEEMVSLQTLQPAQVSLAAAALAQAFVVVTRTSGPHLGAAASRAGAPTPTATTATQP